MEIKLLDNQDPNGKKASVEKLYRAFAPLHYEDESKSEDDQLLSRPARFGLVEVNGAVAGVLIYGTYGGKKDFLWVQRIIVLAT